MCFVVLMHVRHKHTLPNLVTFNMGVMCLFLDLSSTNSNKKSRNEILLPIYSLLYI